MPNIKPLRQYNEADVINLYSYDGTLDKGTIVKVTGSGWYNAGDKVNYNLPLGNTYNNTFSPRWGVDPKIAIATSGDREVLGMTLYDVKEADENGEKLIYNPRKQDEMQCVLSGQAVPVLTKGIVLYTGLNAGDNPSAGAPAYVSGGAGLVGSAQQTGIDFAAPQIGTFLGVKDAKGWILLKLDI